MVAGQLSDRGSALAVSIPIKPRSEHHRMPSMKAIRKVLVADDHDVVWMGLKQLLSEEPDIAVQGGATTGHEVLERVRKERWDLVVLDITLPGLSGVEILKELRKTHPALPVLVFTMHPEDQYALRMLRAGANGYITKGSMGKEIVRAMKIVLGGGTYVSSTLKRKLTLERVRKIQGPPHAGLSDREHQVLIMIASGKTVGEIAEELALSVKTVSTYRARILEKMNMRTNAELTHYALKNRLVD